MANEYVTTAFNTCNQHSGVAVEIKNLKRTCEEQWERINMIERSIQRAMGAVIVQAIVFIGGLVLFIFSKF